MKTTPSAEKTTGEILRSLKIGQFTTISKIDQCGALQARRLASGTITFYWRYTHDGKSDRVVIGPYDASAPPKSLSPGSKGYSVAAATEACRERATIQVQNAPVGGYRGHVASIKRDHEAAQNALTDAQEHSVSKLLDAYVSYLEGKERRSASDARSIFKHHVKDAHPDIANGPAVHLTPENVTDMMRTLIKAEKGRTANKLRSYLLAAYQCGLDSKSRASIPAIFKSFKISSNPVALTKRESEFDKADKNQFELEELQTYWGLIKDIAGIRGAALRLHLLSGGQRIEQLCKLKRENVTDKTFTLFDGKGRPGKPPRVNFLPLFSGISAAISELAKENTGEYAISTDGGATPLSAMTMTNWAKDVAKTKIDNFQLKRVRSGVETALAVAGVSREIRAHLQSHGLTGVQDKHYDGHDYVPEKQFALEVLHALLEGKQIKLIPSLKLV
ncbi:integrase [Rhodoferax sp. GW822-FHT02A01]|uniref:integrase n=1 Tax=Rhodoferax sp. GW822-FHT02A01 TaxID=3141537 RepID=UPI00315CFB8C